MHTFGFVISGFQKLEVFKLNRILFVIAFLQCNCFIYIAGANSLSDSLKTSRRELSELLLSYDYIEKLQRIDELNNKLLFGYNKSSDVKHELDSIITTEWLKEQSWITNSIKYTCSFEDEGKHVTIHKFNWNSESDIWGRDDQYIYNFDDEGNVVRFESREYINADYRFYTRIDYDYENGVLKAEILSDRIDEIETWNILERTFYSYDSLKMLQAVYISDWDFYEEVWVTTDKVEYDRDSLENIILEEGFIYYNHYEVWEKNYEIVHTYGASNNLLESVEYVPGWEEGVYVPEKRQMNTYNSKGEIIRELFSDYSYDKEDWISKIRKEYSHNIVGDKLFESAGFLWNETEQRWIGDAKMEYYSYNKFSDSDVMNWRFLQMYLPMYLYDGKVIDEILYLRWLNDEWVDDGASIYYFSHDYPVGTENFEKRKLLIYPNPVSGFLNIEIDNFLQTDCEIRDVNGRLVFKSTFENSKKLNLSHLEPGVYIVNLRQMGKNAHTVKIIKK